MAASIPHPIPYQGSKRSLAGAILSYFPPNCWQLIEPFAGSAAVSLAAACAGKASAFWLNDLNAPLMALWESIIASPDELADAYERLWQGQLGQEREYYARVRDAFNAEHRPEQLLFLLVRCVKASVRYSSDGRFNQSPDNRRRGTHPDTMRSNLRGAARLLAGRTRATALDYRDVLESADPLDLVYMDPPYQGVCGSRDPRYLGGVPFDEFTEALSRLNHGSVPYIVSYDGRCGDRSYGQPMPRSLELTQVEVTVGRSSQATLLGRNHVTVESLYISPVLAQWLGKSGKISVDLRERSQYVLFEV